jgi:hypothetical protein
MACAVTDLGSQKWQSHFYGVWQGVPIDYTVPFIGPPSQLRGTALIAGAYYTWTGAIRQETPAPFTGTFEGDRYEGYFDRKVK